MQRELITASEARTTAIVWRPAGVSKTALAVYWAHLRRHPPPDTDQLRTKLAALDTPTQTDQTPGE